MPRLILGYHGTNQHLADDDHLMGRTARQATILKLNAERAGSGAERMQQLFMRNVEDLLNVIRWNVKHQVHFYRIPSSLAPHITNPILLRKRDRDDYQALGYSMQPAEHLFQQIGQLARQHNMRLTFHPGQFVSLSSANAGIVMRSYRELYYHYLMIQMMGLDTNSVCIVHGGGTYGDKPAAMRRWVKNFRAMPAALRNHIALENDEKSYNISDVLWISRHCGVPVVFDIFHYQVYNARNFNSSDSFDSKNQKNGETPMSLPEVFQGVIRSWGNRQVKMHISNQRKSAPLGAHADYVKDIPDELLQFPKTYGVDLYLMIEAKKNELAMLRLRKKYQQVM